MISKYQIFLGPVLSEKSEFLNKNFNKILFKVSLSANKSLLKNSFCSIFSIKILKINTLIKRGRKRRYKIGNGIEKKIKKVIFTLAKSASFNVFDEINKVLL